jgi:hypothetical protein
LDRDIFEFLTDFGEEPVDFVGEVEGVGELLFVDGGEGNNILEVVDENNGGQFNSVFDVDFGEAEGPE